MHRAGIAAFWLVALGASGCDIFTALTGGIGLPCADDQACGNGTLCIEKKCQRPAACRSSDDCAAGSCVNGICLPGGDAGPSDAHSIDLASRDAIGDQYRFDRGGNDSGHGDNPRDAAAPDTLAPDSGAADGSSATDAAPDVATAADHSSEDSAAGHDAGSPDAGGCWYDPDWRMRWPLTIAAANDTLNDFPLLVRLDCAAVDCHQFGANGAHLRFTDVSCTLLPHEIEHWAESGETAVWVKVPSIGTANPGAVVYLYGANESGLVSDPLPIREVWPSGFQGVYHLNGSADDSSQRANNGSVNATGITSGQIGGAQAFASGQWIKLGDDQPLLRSVAGATISAWLRLDSSTSPSARNVASIAVFNGGTATNNSRAALAVEATGLASGTARREDTTSSFSASFGTVLAANQFIHLTMRIRYSDAMMDMYVNGAQVGSTTMAPTLAPGSTPDTNSQNAAIGSSDTGDMNYFAGSLDEVRIERVARSAAWIEMSYRSQMTNSPVVTFEPVETY